MFILVRGVWVSVAQDCRILYNYLAYRVHDFLYGSSGIVKRLIELCLFNSELPNWATVKSPSETGDRSELPSKSIKRLKGSTRRSVINPWSNDVRSTLNLELTLISACRHYSTTLSSAPKSGMRKRRKSSANFPTVVPVSSQQIEMISSENMKERKDSISDTTSPKAMGSADIPTVGLPGVFDSLRNLEKIDVSSEK